MHVTRRCFASITMAGLLVAACASLRAAPMQTASEAEVAASKLLAAQDWMSALSAYRALAAAEPSNPRAAFGLGVALHETGRPTDAIEPLQRARTLGFQPINQVRFRLARAYAKAGDAARAFAMLDELVANNFVNTAVMSSPDFAALSSERFAAIVKAVNDRAHPCGADPAYRQFDFWIGVWDVQPTGAARAASGGATSRVERQLDGCVVQENWEPLSGPGGKSFNIYNRVSKRWEQHWVDASGNITLYTGEFRADGNLYFEGDQFGSSNKIRMTFFNQGPDQLRQLGHTSTDGGKTWTISFDLTYVRKK